MAALRPIQPDDGTAAMTTPGQAKSHVPRQQMKRAMHPKRHAAKLFGSIVAMSAASFMGSVWVSSVHDDNAGAHPTDSFKVSQSELLAKPQTQSRRLYECGWPLPKLKEELFGKLRHNILDSSIHANSAIGGDGISSINHGRITFQHVGGYHRNAESSSNDILLFGMHGDCNGTTKHDNLKADYVETHFAGKALLVNGEPYASIFPLSKHPCNLRFGCPKSARHLYQIGTTIDAYGPHTIRVFYAAVILIEHFTPEQREWIFDHKQKRHMERRSAQLPIGRKNTHRGERFTPHAVRNAVIYMSRRCVDHRQSAAGSISTIVPVHHGKICEPNADKVPQKHIQAGHQPQIVPVPDLSFIGADGREAYWENYKLYSTYKYCICMENTQIPGYISEKLILAFLGGCLPIYWGTEEVFEVFNHDAFLFYDAENPEPTLARLRYLESNYTAYHEMMVNQPILRDGPNTVREFFSLSKAIGGGHLRRRILNMLELEDDDE